ncbi:MAG: dephospho-CoA kinase [Calditerrivibrio sp.]|nr:dephospho-CoA kinase [Calditerrivibrio sp.]
MKRIRYLGLTGGIASGKSTVANFFKELGCFIIDADEISKIVMNKTGSAYQDIVNFFGASILDKDHEIDRKKLKELVFNNEPLRFKLESIVHPKILEYEKKLISEFKSKNDKDLIITQAALIIEKGTYKRFDAVILIYSDEQTQLKRVIQRDNIAPDLAKKIIQSQMSFEEKAKFADFIIDNSKDLLYTKEEVKRVFKLIQKINYGLKHQKTTKYTLPL